MDAHYTKERINKSLECHSLTSQINIEWEYQKIENMLEVGDGYYDRVSSYMYMDTCQRGPSPFLKLRQFVGSKIKQNTRSYARSLRRRQFQQISENFIHYLL